MVRSRSTVFCVLHFSALLAVGQYWPEVIISAPIDMTAGGRFGASVSLDQNMLLVGAPGASVDASGGGAAYLFARNEGGLNAWGLVGEFHLGSPVVGAGFGSRVLLVGDLAFISAPADLRSGVRTGSVSVFQRDIGGPGQWGFVQRLLPDTVQEGLRFGSQMHFGQGSLLVACPGYDEDPNPSTRVGAMVVHSLDQDELFVPVRFIPGSALVDTVTARPCMGDWFTLFQGFFVHVENEGVGGEEPGRGYVLDVDSLLDPSLPLPRPRGIALDDQFGDTLNNLIFTKGASDDTRLCLGLFHKRVVGAHGEYHRAVAFSFDGDLQQEGSALPDTTAPYLQYWPSGREGWDLLGMSNGRMLVGALGDSTFTPLGHAEVFAAGASTNSDWTAVGYLQPSDPHAGDLFGSSGTMGADIAVVGAPNHDVLDRGQVYIFQDPSVGLPEDGRKEQPRLLAYPSPVASEQGHLEVVLSAPPSGRFIMRDAQGTTVWTGQASARTRISTNGWAAGPYLLQWIPEQRDEPPAALRIIIAP